MPRRPTSSKYFSQRPLGARIPRDKKHLLLYPARQIDVNPKLELKRPRYVVHNVSYRYDQGKEGACVGYACAAWATEFLNHHNTPKVSSVTFNAYDIYLKAKQIDEFPGENYEGTSLRAGLEVLRTYGAVSSSYKIVIDEYRWATSPEDIFDHLAFVGPVCVSTAWYEEFDKPVKHPFASDRRRMSFFIGEKELGKIRGYHAILMDGYYRNRNGEEWVRYQNSWGFDYPLVWMPAKTVRRLWDIDQLEGAMITKIRSVEKL